MNEMRQHDEDVSALADGRLQGDEFARAVDKVGTQSELLATWRIYHLVGDVLRSGGHMPCTDGAGFVARLQQRLAGERIDPGVLAPLSVRARLPRRAEAANAPVFRWKLVAGLASLAAAAAVSWNWVGGSTLPVGAQMAQGGQPKLASASVLAASQPPDLNGGVSGALTRIAVGNTAGGPPQVVLRDHRLDQFLAAHQEMGRSSMPSGFMRNATFEEPSR